MQSTKSKEKKKKAKKKKQKREAPPISTKGITSYNPPRILTRMAKLAARDARAQAIVADTNRIVLERVGKVIAALGHGADEHADTLVLAQRLDVVVDAHDGGLEAEGDLAAVGRQVVGDGVLDDAQQLLLRVGGADGQAVQELHHEACEALEGAWDADGRADFDQHALGGVDVDLESAGFVDGRVEEREEALNHT